MADKWFKSFCISLAAFVKFSSLYSSVGSCDASWIMAVKWFKSFGISLVEFVKFSLSFSIFDEDGWPIASSLDTDERADDKLWYFSSLEIFFWFSFSSGVK